MSVAAANGNWLATMKAHLAADKRKTAALGVLTLVMLGVWGRLYLKSSDGTATTVAALSPELVAAVSIPDAGTTHREPEMDEPSVHDSRGARATPVVDIRKANRQLSRDFFASDWNQFAVAAGSEPAADGKRAAAPGAWERVAASVRRERDRKRREAELVRNKAANLTVQSTIIGDRSSAVISGHLVHVGDSIDGFEVDEIAARAVAVRKDGVRVTIRMP